MSSESRIVFLITESFPGWHWILIALLLVVVSIGLPCLPPKLRSAISGADSPFVKFVMIPLSLLFLALTSTILASYYLDLRSAYVSGDRTVVEGRVHGFGPRPGSVPGAEGFFVDKVEFVYSEYFITGGFNKNWSESGPIVRDGLTVRVHYVERKRGRVILKLEILEPRQRQTG